MIVTNCLPAAAEVNGSSSRPAAMQMVTANGAGHLSVLVFTVLLVAAGVVTANGTGPPNKMLYRVSINKKEERNKTTKKTDRQRVTGTQTK